MVARGQLTLLGAALTVSTSSLSGAILKVWTRHWCTKPRGKRGSSGTLLLPRDICIVPTCWNDTWKARPALCCSLRIIWYIIGFVVLRSTTSSPALVIYADCQGGRRSAIWYLVRHLHMRCIKPVGKKAVLMLRGQILLSVTPEECDWSQYDLQELRTARGLGFFLRWHLDSSCS